MSEGIAWSEDTAPAEEYSGPGDWREWLARQAGRIFALSVVALVVVSAWWWVAAQHRTPATDPVASLPPAALPASELPPISGAPLLPPDVTAVPPIARADADQRFLALVTARTGLPITDPARAVAGGREVCQYLAVGHSEADAVAAAVRNNPVFTDRTAAAYVDTAVQVYCREPTS